MTLTPVLYNFTANDTNAIKTLEYGIINVRNDNTNFNDFMQVVYPNFNLQQLLLVVEKILVPVTSIKVDKKIIFDTGSDELTISFRNQYRNEVEALVFERKFLKDLNDITVYHSYFILPSTHQRMGLAKPIFQESLQQYINMGVLKIVVHAGLSGGGYTWAKHGFTIIKRNEVDVILTKARKDLFPNEFQPVERIYNHYYNNPDPVSNHKAFPVILWANIPYMKTILMGSNWNGQLDLKNPEQITNFTNYVFRN